MIVVIFLHAEIVVFYKIFRLNCSHYPEIFHNKASNIKDDDDQSTQGFDWPDNRSEGGGSVVSAFSQAFSQLDSNISESNAGGDAESAYGEFHSQYSKLDTSQYGSEMMSRLLM